MISSDWSLSEASMVIKDLLEQAQSLCPEEIPPPQAALTDKTLLRLLLAVVRASGFDKFFERVQGSTLEMAVPESYLWLQEALADPQPPESWLDALFESIAESGLGVVTQLEVYSPVFDWDEMSYCLSARFLPFSLALFACDYLPDLGFFEVYECDFGHQASGAGVLAAAISPYFETEYRAEILTWKDEDDTIRGLDRFPLLAFLLADHGLPGIRHELLSGQMNKTIGAETVPWFLLPELFPELDVIDKADTIIRANLTMPANWLVVQILNIFRDKE